MNKSSLLVLFIVAIAGCGTSEQAASDVPNHPADSDVLPVGKSATSDSTNLAAKKVAADDGADDEVYPRSFAVQSVKGTGVKRRVLLAAMNHNSTQDQRYHHEFKLSKVVDFDDGDVMMYYTDSHSTLTLSVLGPENDVTLIELMMPVEDYLPKKGDNGEMTAEGAAAFGRCVHRLGLAVDPNWMPELFDWMISHVDIALLTKRGATVTRRGLVAQFDVQELPPKATVVRFAIGTFEPAK